MGNSVSLSSLRNCLLRALCSRGFEFSASWDVDIEEAIQTFGNITLGEMRQKLYCRARCLQAMLNAPLSADVTNPRIWGFQIPIKISAAKSMLGTRGLRRLAPGLLLGSHQPQNYEQATIELPCFCHASRGATQPNRRQTASPKSALAPEQFSRN